MACVTLIVYSYIGNSVVNASCYWRIVYSKEEQKNVSSRGKKSVRSICSGKINSQGPGIPEKQNNPRIGEPLRQNPKIRKTCSENSENSRISGMDGTIPPPECPKLAFQIPIIEIPSLKKYLLPAIFYLASGRSERKAETQCAVTKILVKEEFHSYT